MTSQTWIPARDAPPTPTGRRPALTLSRTALVGLVLLSTSCASLAPGPLTLPVEVTLECVVTTVETTGFEEEHRWRGSGRSTVSVRFRRAGDELTVTIDEEGGEVRVGYGYRGDRRAIMEPEVNRLRILVRSRCLP